MSKLERLKPVKKARIGLYSVGLKAYWDQFEGLKDRLVDYGKFVEGELSELGEVFNYGLVDDEVLGRDAGEWFNSQNVDIVFCHTATYFVSSTVLPIHQICSAPVIVLNLQPAASMDYERTGTGEWLAHCVACPIPEIANVFDRVSKKYKIINGLLGLRETPEISLTNEVTAQRPEAIRAWKEIKEWVQAATVKRTLQHSRFGFLGSSYSGMLDMYSDFTMMQAEVGMHVEILEMCDLDKYLGEVTEEERELKKEEVEQFFEISGDSPSDPIAKAPSQEQLNWSCTVAAAQEKMVKAYNLDAISYYYHGADNHYEKLQGGFTVGHSLLTARGIPCAGEADMKTALAMKICDTLDTGGSYIEIITADYDRGTMILGHDGPFHILISEGKPVLRGMGIYHGKKGTGVAVEANVKPGPVTTLGIAQTGEGKLKMIISEGEAIKAPVLSNGNTQTHVKFGKHPNDYMDSWFAEGPTHHWALSVGHNASLFEKVAELLGVEKVIIK